jgi:hypothetical protein
MSKTTEFGKKAQGTLGVKRVNKSRYVIDQLINPRQYGGKNSAKMVCIQVDWTNFTLDAQQLAFQL